jgi:PPM family protein phosphatase
VAVALRIVEHAGRTDVGRQRNANEDSLVVDPPLFAVADGMGGAKAGEVASAVAVEAVEGATESGEPAEAQLASIVRQANRRIYDLAVADESRRGMGTTLTLAKVHGDEVSLAHVGDSRAYRLRDGQLEQLTRDHSLVAELERSGQITPEAAEHHPQRSIITRALGPEPDVEVDTYTLAGREGDVFLICSDGLTSMIADDEVGSILRSAGSLDGAADELIRAANQSGGKDNITVILFRLGEGEGEGEGEGKAAEYDAPATPAPADEDTIVGGISAAEVAAGAPGAPAAPAAAEPLTALGDAPADATIVRPPAPKTAPAAPAQATTRRRRRGRRVVGAAVGLLLVAGVIGGLYALSRQVYFIGTNDAGLVTVYKGLPYELPLGINLYEEEYASGMPARAIPVARRNRVLDHEWRSRADAVDLVRALERGRLDAGAGN